MSAADVRVHLYYISYAKIYRIHNVEIAVRCVKCLSSFYFRLRLLYVFFILNCRYTLHTYNNLKQVNFVLQLLSEVRLGD